MSSAAPAPPAAPSDTGSSSTPAPATTAAPTTTYSIPTTAFTQTTGDNGETQTIDDTDPSIIYTAPGTIPWNVTSDQNAYNHTIHQTSCNSCMATLLFNGTGVSLTSMLSPQGSLFIVILDGTSAGAYSLQSANSQPAVVYTIENLQSGQHNATFMKASSNPNDPSLFNIDSITVISRPPLTGSSFIPPTASGRTVATNSETAATPSDTAGSAPMSNASSPPPIGAIVGGTIGGILLIVVVVAWIILMRRRKRGGERDTSAASSEKRFAKDAYAHDRYAAPAAAAAAVPAVAYSQHDRERRSQDRRSQDRYAQGRYSQDNKYANGGGGYSRDAYSSRPREAYADNNTRDAYGRSSRDGYPSGRAVSSRDGSNPTGRAVSSRSSRDAYPTAKPSSRRY